jgi:hypothetical protein
MGKITRALLPGKLEATNSAAPDALDPHRLSEGATLSANFDGQMYQSEQPPDGSPGAKMRWETIVEAHGGRIEAESQPGEGTRMSFILPLLQERGKE